MNALEVFRSFEKAAKLATEAHTGCGLTSTVRHIALSPKYIGRLRTGVGEILDAGLGRFSESLRGVLLAYGNIKLLESSGVIIEDNPFIHFDVKFDAVVFNPKRGSFLKCVVTEQASDHVGCLVHDWFNVSLLASRKELPKLEPGRVVLVQVEHLRSLNGMLAIEARAPDDGSDLIIDVVTLQSKDTDSESNVDSALQTSVSDTPDVAGMPAETLPGNETSGKKKKRVKVKIEEVDSLQPSVSDAPGVTSLPTVTAGTEASRKKKKKKCAKMGMEEIDSLQPSVSDAPGVTLLATVTAGTEASRKKKKKYAKMGTEEIDSLQPSVSDYADGSGMLEATSRVEAKREKKKKKKHSNAEQESGVDSLQPPANLQDGSGSSERTAGEEAGSRKKKKKRNKVSQEWGVATLKPPLCLETSTGQTQTGVEQRSKQEKSKKHKQSRTTDETANGAPNNADALTTGEQTSRKKEKKEKKKRSNKEAAPNTESLTNHSGDQIPQVTAGTETNSAKKKKKKNSIIRTEIDFPQSSVVPNGPSTITLDSEVDMASPGSLDDDVVSNLLPLFNEQSPAENKFTELKKHRRKDIYTDVDSPLKPSSPSKKHKKKLKQETSDGNKAFALNSLTDKRGTGTKPNGVSGSPLTPVLDAEVRGHKSHKKHKRKGAEIDSSLTGGGKKKRKIKEM